MSRTARTGSRSPSRRSSAHARGNRAFWNRQSDRYDRRFRNLLRGVHARAWGVWRIPEAKVRLLGETRGRRVLEYGCGAARWASALARTGSWVVGLDQSSAQLRHAPRGPSSGGRGPRLVLADAERTPFRSNSFDVVFCDWGAMTFADPYRTVPEVARLLRAGGRFVFSTHSPIFVLAIRGVDGPPTRRLQRGYFALHRIREPGATEFQLPYGEWIRLFRESGFSVERLLETRPEPGMTSRYVTRVEQRWSRQWPREAIWQLRKLTTIQSPGGRTGPRSTGPRSRRAR